jgi:hypothetical protein
VENNIVIIIRLNSTNNYELSEGNVSIHLSSQALEWDVNYLTINDGPILNQKKIIQTPYSEVFKIETALGKTFYLKQVPEALFLEPIMLAYFHEQDCQNTPKLVTKNNILHCCLMISCGDVSLRSLFKGRVNLDMLNQGITNYTKIQRCLENKTQERNGLKIIIFLQSLLSFFVLF